MVELKATLTKGGSIYLPKELRQGFTRELKLISNGLAALIFPSTASYDDVLDSLKVIEVELNHRIKLSRKTKD
ncbi:MAG: hypothetical protein QXN24_04880 [Candidatus Bathyarchaeia archaeon]